MNNLINNVLIYGNGVMGNAVAKTFAAAGFSTVVKSRRPIGSEDRPQALRIVNTLPTVPPELVIEFVPEDILTKKEVLSEIQHAYPGANVILATGTSGLDLVQLTDGLPQPEKLVGMHYFMPADKSPIVEVMAGPTTGKDIVDQVADVVRRTGKQPVRLYQPVVGFLLNRLQHAILHEAYYLMESGVATAEDIDLAARRLFGPRMCLNGLLRQKDLSGLAVHAAAQKTIVPTLYHNRTPSPLLQNMVARGETGIDAGRGFYEWSGATPEDLRRRVSKQLEELISFLDNRFKDNT